MILFNFHTVVGPRPNVAFGPKNHPNTLVRTSKPAHSGWTKTKCGIWTRKPPKHPGRVSELGRRALELPGRALELAERKLQASQLATKGLPAGLRTPPAGSMTLPAGSEAFPAGSETVPAVSETAPAGNVALSPSSKALQASSVHHLTESEPLPASLQSALRPS